MQLQQQVAQVSVTFIFCGVGYLGIPLYDLLQQVVQVLITWNTGFLVGYLIILWCE